MISDVVTSSLSSYALYSGSTVVTTKAIITSGTINIDYIVH